MTHIRRISRLRNCRIFRSFTWSSDLPCFRRHNLIYGWNGTGKTTLSRLFRDLELRREPKHGNVVLHIDGHDVRGNHFSQSSVPVRVFNRDFINDSVFPVGRDEMPPIFVVGIKNVGKQRRIERLKKKRSGALSALDTARANSEAAEKDIDRLCVERAKNIKDMLRSGGDSPYNNYDKSDYQRDAEQLAQTPDLAGARLSRAEREARLVRHRETLKPTVDKVSYAFPNAKSIAEQVSKLLNKTVVTAVIDALKDDADLSNWIRQGLALHRDRSAELCKFCDQRLPEDRLAVLEGHFSDRYEQLIGDLDKQIGELRGFDHAAEEIRPPYAGDLYDDLRSEFENSETKLKTALAHLRKWLSAAMRALENKKRNIFDQVELESGLPQVDPSAVEQLNRVIEKHNKACENFDAQITKARKQLATDTIVRGLEDFVTRKDAAERAKVILLEREQEIQRLGADIASLEREIIEHRRPAEELTEDLRKYLCHGELRLEVKDTGYTLMRDGEPAQSLSEGETTAIALLYFLKSLQDRQFDMKNGVIVLDDPVSSLDANALFLAFGFIQDCTRDAGQLFVLTHNFSFFRQVHNWFFHLNRQDRKHARFFMIDTMLKDGIRSSTIRRLDPLLEHYESEYHYLFVRIYRAASETTSQGIEQNYILPNMARRVLEAFLAFRQPQKQPLWNKLDKIGFDPKKKRRIFRFVNAHSHSNAVGEPEHDLTALAEGPAVLKDLLEMIKSLDNEHYAGMMKLAKPGHVDAG